MGKDPASQPRAHLIGKAPARPKDGEIDFASVPEKVRQALEALRETGWTEAECGNEAMPLHWASKYGRADVCSFLLSVGGEPPLLLEDERGRTPLELAQQYGFSAVAAALREPTRTARSQVASKSKLDRIVV